jgi:hypothetical protein
MNFGKIGCEVDGTDTGSCQVVQFNMSSAEYSGSVSIVAVAEKS